MKVKYIKRLVIISALLIIVLVASSSYAFFVVNVNGNSVASESVITTGHMEITYNEGNIIGTTNNMIPGDYIEKYFRVTNTGNVDTYYDIYLNDVVNTFSTKSDLAFTLISEGDKGKSVTQTTCPDKNTKIASGIKIGVGEYHNYTLKITFKNLNRNQDDNKGKGFSARIDLVENEAPTKNIAEQLIDYEKVSDSLVYDGVDILGTNGTSDNNLRYVGQNPNNYIYFNCSTTNVDEMNDETCEKWRIIGLFSNIEDDNGNIASRVKIVRNESLGYYSWDTSSSTVNSGYGINQWGASGDYEGADLMRELNTDYLGNITVGSDGKWYGNSNDSKNRVMPSKALYESAQNMIQDVKWMIGSDGNRASTMWTTKNMYDYERSNNIRKNCSSGDECNDTVERTSFWIGKVALIYPSDYGYATSGGLTVDRDMCLNKTLFNWQDGDYSECKANSWINKSGISQWSLFTHASSTRSSRVFYIGSSGSSVSRNNASSSYGVYPSVFLKSTVSIESGSGSLENPYRLKI